MRRSSWNARKNPDASAIGCPAEQMSWWKPGSVSSAVRLPPPIVSARSCTSTRRPARAIVTAAASPFGPDPTTIASMSAMRRGYRRRSAAVPAMTPDRSAPAPMATVFARLRTIHTCGLIMRARSLKMPRAP